MNLKTMTPEENAHDGLSGYREQINNIDDELIDLLARRFEVCKAVAHHKKRHGIAVILPDRIEAVKERCAKRALQSGLDDDFARNLYDFIITEVCAMEAQLIEQ